MTTTPILATKDQIAIRQLTANLPHALLIVAKRGRDGQGAAREIARRVAAELRFLQPIDGKPSISTEQIRQLTASLRTHATTRRLILVHPADHMTEQAQNALLKNLEEPGAHTHFVLVAEAAENLLPTIRSRCQSITLQPTSPAQDAKLLDDTPLSEQQKQQVLFLAAGRPLLIRQLAHQPRRLAEYQTLATDAKTILAAPRSYAAFQVISKYLERDKALEFLDILLRLIHFRLATGTPDRRIFELSQRVIDAEASLRANGNPRLNLLNIVL